MTPTPALEAVALYAGLLGLILVAMIFAVIRQRFRLKISIGDGGEKDMARAMRGHANFIETAGPGLILLLLMAMMGTPAWVVHLMGIALLLGRVLHAAVFFLGANFRLRQLGMVITIIYLITAATGLILHALL